ncbi:MAG: hypothetical protein ACC652_05965 [Acidimicrobiales bacterium]
MAIHAETIDCVALSDADLEEMANLATEEPRLFDIGLLSKEQDSWVLITRAYVNGNLHGFSFCTLERIGGTPSVVVGMASVKRTNRRTTVLKAIMTDQLRRAVLAFPDEDVLVGARIWRPGAFEAFKSLKNIVPRPDHDTSGEERAWGRRLVKRFNVDGTYDDRAFTITGRGAPTSALDYAAARPEALDPRVHDYFHGLDPEEGDCLVAFGWAMVEDLAKLA